MKSKTLAMAIMSLGLIGCQSQNYPEFQMAVTDPSLTYVMVWLDLDGAWRSGAMTVGDFQGYETADALYEGLIAMQREKCPLKTMASYIEEGPKNPDDYEVYLLPCPVPRLQVKDYFEQGHPYYVCQYDYVYSVLGLVNPF